LGLGDNINRRTPEKLLGDFVALDISAACCHSLFIGIDKKVRGFGRNDVFSIDLTIVWTTWRWYSSYYKHSSYSSWRKFKCQKSLCWGTSFYLPQRGWKNILIWTQQRS
jgi:hypothetical protein